jgi:hypothetical protein
MNKVNFWWVKNQQYSRIQQVAAKRTNTSIPKNYWLALVGFLRYGIGSPLIISPAIATVLNSVANDKKGMVAGILNAMRQLRVDLCFVIVSVVITNYLSLQSADNLPTMSFHLYSVGFSYGMMAAFLFSLVTVIFAFFGLKNKLGT